MFHGRSSAGNQRTNDLSRRESATHDPDWEPRRPHQQPVARSAVQRRIRSAWRFSRKHEDYGRRVAEGWGGASGNYRHNR